jgi:hypothetical protein
MTPEWPIDAKRAAHEQTEPTDEERAFIAGYLAKKKAEAEELVEMKRKLIKERDSLRVACAALLAAAKDAVRQGDENRRSFTGRTDECQAVYDRLVAAIAAVEEQAQ